MAVLAASLRALDVPVDVVADFDVLNDLTVFGALVEALGGDDERALADAKPLKDAIEQHKPWLTSAEIAGEIRNIIEGAPESGQFPSALRSRIEQLFRKASPWDAIKDAGEAAIPSGQPTVHYERLRDYCGSIGLWIVPVGELEGFCKAVGGKGPKWTQRVLEKYDLSTAPELAAGRELVSKIWNRLAAEAMTAA